MLDSGRSSLFEQEVFGSYQEEEPVRQVPDRLELMNQPMESHSAEFGDSAGVNPLDHEDITLRVEAGIVRMDEFARLPSARVGADFEAVEDFLSPCFVIAEMNDDVVVLIEERDAGVEIGDQ